MCITNQWTSFHSDRAPWPKQCVSSGQPVTEHRGSAAIKLVRVCMQELLSMYIRTSCAQAQ